MTGDRSRLMNFVKKFIGIVIFGNDHFGSIMGYEDYVIGEIVIFRVYYMEGFCHNLFSVRQFCDSNLEVTFWKHSCYVQDTDGVGLIKGSHSSNFYTISVEDMMKSSPIYMLSKASKNKSWLWYHHLNHLNFGTINDLFRTDLVRGLPRLKFKKDHLCSPCQLGKSKKHTHKPKAKNTIMEVLHTLHMDLCGPILKDETPEVVIKFVQQIQVGLNKTIRYICTDNGTEFVNQTLTDYYEQAAATACYTQNRSLIHTGHNKTPYEFVHNKKPDLRFFRVFGALCYPTNDSEDLGKLQPTVGIGIFVGYAPSRKGYRICNKRTRRIMETIHIQFDELTELMAPVHLSTGPVLNLLTPGQISSGLVPNPVPTTPYVPPTNKELKDYEILFQPLFDEYFNPAPRAVSPVLVVVAAPRAVDLVDSPLSTIIDQDVPSASTSPTIHEIQSQVTHQETSEPLKRSALSEQLLQEYGFVFRPHRFAQEFAKQIFVSLTPYVPPSKKDYEILFQPLFDEYFNPAPRAVSPVLVVVAAPRAVDLVDSPLSTTIDQDVPSANPSFEETTLQGVIPSNLHHLNQSFDTLTKLTKNHRLENVIGDPSRPVSTRKLQEHAIWCYLDANDNPIPLEVSKESYLPDFCSHSENTNFFRAFTASSMILAIYIQQFWDTMCFNSSTGLYSCQLDEQWFNLHKDILIDALDITPTNDNNPYAAPRSSDTIIKYVNTLGYPSTFRNMLAMFVGKDGREIFGMPIPDAFLTDEIKGAPYYSEYQSMLLSINNIWMLNMERHRKDEQQRKIRKPKSPLKLVDEPSDEDVSVEEPAYNEEEENLQRALELSLKE
nr:hypothetical protein [Tanacetum cinerariifolium]